MQQWRAARAPCPGTASQPLEATAGARAGGGAPGHLLVAERHDWRVGHGRQVGWQHASLPRALPPLLLAARLLLLLLRLLRALRQDLLALLGQLLRKLGERPGLPLLSLLLLLLLLLLRRRRPGRLQRDR